MQDGLHSITLPILQAITAELIAITDSVKSLKTLLVKGQPATLHLLFPSLMELRSMPPHEVVTGWKSLMKRQP